MTYKIDTAKQHSTKKRFKRVELPLFAILFILPIPVSFIVRGAGITLGILPAIVASILHMGMLMLLVVYFLKKNGESLREVGLKFENFAHELARGLLLLFPVLLTTGIIAQFLRLAGFPVGPNPLQEKIAEMSRYEQTILLALMGLVAISEEFIFRGYLIQRLRLLYGSTLLAILASSFIFSLGHSYQGPLALVVTFFLGLILSLIYVRTGSLIAPITIHFLNNCLAVVFWAWGGNHNFPA